MHVAIIMQGNGQWAIQRDLPATAGCAAGVAALRSAVALAAAARVETLTLYSICSSTCDRPWQDVDADLGVLRRFLRLDLSGGPEDCVRISLIGNNDPLTWLLPQGRADNVHLGVAGIRLHLRIVVDYSAHDRITRAAWRSSDLRAPEEFFRQLHQIDPTALPAGPVDLLVRTGGGTCLSDFMLWEVAHAKLHFVERLWPDFTADDFQDALNSCTGRGLVPAD